MQKLRFRTRQRKSTKEISQGATELRRVCPESSRENCPRPHCAVRRQCCSPQPQVPLVRCTRRQQGYHAIFQTSQFTTRSSDFNPFRFRGEYDFLPIRANFSKKNGFEVQGVQPFPTIFPAEFRVSHHKWRIPTTRSRPAVMRSQPQTLNSIFHTHGGVREDRVTMPREQHLKIQCGELLE